MSPSLRSPASAHQRIVGLASDRAVHRAFAWLHLHEPQLLRWQTEFLPIEAPSFGEARRAAWFLERFQELGLAGCHMDAEGNVLGELQTSATAQAGKGPMVLLSAHLDTVFPPGTDCTPRQAGTRLLGPGACDNGAGLAALLGLAAAFQAASLKPACRLLFAANVGEEGEGDLRGMRHLFTESPFARHIRAVLALEGSGAATVVDRALGSRRLRVEVNGPGGHSWADTGTPNPILALAAALLELGRISLPETPRTTLNCGTLHGGTSVNSIPENAVAQLDLRSASSLELDRLELQVLDRLTRFLRSAPGPNGTGGLPGLAQPGSLQFKVDRIGDRPAATLPANSPLRSSLLAVDRHLSIPTEFRIGSTDANLPLSLGIPALAIGAGGTGGGIHTLHEWYDPTGRQLALRRILLLLLDTATLVAAQA